MQLPPDLADDNELSAHSGLGKDDILPIKATYRSDQTALKITIYTADYR